MRPTIKASKPQILKIINTEPSDILFLPPRVKREGLCPSITMVNPDFSAQAVRLMQILDCTHHCGWRSGAACLDRDTISGPCTRFAVSASA